MKTTSLTRALFAAATGLGLLALCATSAQAEYRGPALPTFDCSVYFGAGNAPMVKVTRSNSAAVDATKDVVAVITTPGGKRDAGFCGSAFPAQGSSASGSWVNGPTQAGYIYICSASQSSTTNFCRGLH